MDENASRNKAVNSPSDDRLTPAEQDTPAQADPKTSHDRDLCNAAEVLAFAAITRLLANMTIQRSALFDCNMGMIVEDVADALTDAAWRIGLDNLTK